MKTKYVNRSGVDGRFVTVRTILRPVPRLGIFYTNTVYGQGQFAELDTEVVTIGQNVMALTGVALRAFNGRGKNRHAVLRVYLSSTRVTEDAITVWTIGALQEGSETESTDAFGAFEIGIRDDRPVGTPWTEYSPSFAFPTPGDGTLEVLFRNQQGNTVMLNAPIYDPALGKWVIVDDAAQSIKNNEALQRRTTIMTDIDEELSAALPFLATWVPDILAAPTMLSGFLAPDFLSDVDHGVVTMAPQGLANETNALALMQFNPSSGNQVVGFEFHPGPAQAPIGESTTNKTKKTSRSTRDSTTHKAKSSRSSSKSSVSHQGR